MKFKMTKLPIAVIYLLSVFGKIHTWTQTLSVDAGDCSTYQLYHVNNDHQYEIDWNGGQIPIYCTFGFVGRDSGYQNEYKVCVEATYYSVTDCDVELKYEIGISSIVQETHSCYETVGTFCGDSDDYVDVEFSTKSYMHSGNAGKITLKVTADMTYNFAVTVGASVAGAVVGVIVISVCVTLLIRQRNRRFAGIIQSTSTPYSSQTNAYMNQQQNVANPQMYPNSQQYAAPPPSYQNAVTSSGNLVSPVAGSKY